jgi:hypothetical protein
MQKIEGKQNMTEQYLRTIKLIVGGSQAPGIAANPNAAIDLSQLHITFEVRNATTQSLKFAKIMIYNLADETANSIQNEFTRVELSAGYGDDAGMIFQGQIAIVKRGKLNATDTFVEITAQDGDAAYNFAVSNRTLAKGWTAEHLYDALLQDMAPYGITAGYKPPFTSSAASRGKACYGMVRDYLRDLADQQGCEWNIEDGRLNFVPLTSYVPGQAIVLTSDTGMIGTPTQTTGGIEVRSLLNSLIKAGGQIVIDNSSLSTMTIKNQITGQAPQLVAGKDKEGHYKALCVSHRGDTRGQDWYTYMICLAVDPTAAIPLGGPTLLAVPG